MSKRAFSREEFDSIYNRVPRLTVEVVARTVGGIILTKRAMEPCEGMWHIPGGTVWMRERLAETVARVADDELGVSVEIQDFLGYIEYPKLAAAGYDGWPVGLVFDTNVTGGVPRGSEQGEEIGYFTKVPPHTIPEQADFLNERVFKNT